MQQQATIYTVILIILFFYACYKSQGTGLYTIS